MNERLIVSLLNYSLMFEVYTAESVSLFVSSTTFPTDLIENI